jgi:hypothetical protein
MAANPKHLFEPLEQDDKSTHLHRQLVGYVAIALPWVVLLLHQWRPTKELLSLGRLDSISAYYYTAGIAALVGSLAALTAFFVTYRGYDNENRGGDLFAAWVAGGAALLVAFFPTDAPIKQMRPSWWAEWMGVTHFVAAAVLFLILTYFSIALFPKSKGNAKPRRFSSKWWRNVIHYTCGVVMVVCIIWAWSWRPVIFWPEAVALMAFGLSWLVKGRVDATLVTVLTDPAAVVREMREATQK